MRILQILGNGVAIGCTAFTAWAVFHALRNLYDIELMLHGVGK